MTEASDGMKLTKAGWLPIVLCPTDGVDRALLLPDGSEIVGAYHKGGLGQARGWQTRAPFEHDEPVYEYDLPGGFVADPTKFHSLPEPRRKQVGTRKAVMWLMGRLPDGVYPTHFRPNDTVYGDPLQPTARSALQSGEPS